MRAISQIHVLAQSLFKDYPSLNSLFEKEYGVLEEEMEREAIVETIFLDNYLFPEKEIG